jgi:hypothetical protein
MAKSGQIVTRLGAKGSQGCKQASEIGLFDPA